MNGIFITTKTKLFTKYMEMELGCIYDCYNADVTEDFEEVKLSGSDG